MKKKLQSVTGRTQEVQSLDEIITGRKANKFAKYPTREGYKEKIYEMSHIELAEEMLRLGETAKSEKSFMRTRLLEMYDRAQKPRKVTLPVISSKNLEDIIGEN